jgi:hypothetical protein
MDCFAGVRSFDGRQNIGSQRIARLHFDHSPHDLKLLGGQMSAGQVQGVKIVKPDELARGRRSEAREVKIRDGAVLHGCECSGFAHGFHFIRSL